MRWVWGTCVAMAVAAACWLLVEGAHDDDAVLVGPSSVAASPSGAAPEADVVTSTAPRRLVAPVEPTPGDDHTARPLDEARIGRVPRPARITARVVDVSGAPIAGARLTFLSRVTDFDRRFCGEGLADRELVATSADDGRVEIPVSRDDALALARLTTVEQATVEADGFATAAAVLEAMGVADVALGDVVLQPEVVLTGRVVDLAGRPLLGATVTAIDDRDITETQHNPTARDSHLYLALPRRSAVTDADGRFAIHRLRAAFYEVDVVADGFAPHQARRSVSVPAASESPGPVDLGDLVLEAGRRLEGTVSCPGHGVVAGARVIVARRHLRADDWSALVEERDVDGVWSTTTGADGRYLLDGVSRDDVALFAFAAGVGRLQRVRSDEVGADEEHVDVDLQPAVARSYACIDASTGEPVVPEHVEAFAYAVPASGDRATCWSRLPVEVHADDPSRVTITHASRALVRVRAPGYLPSIRFPGDGTIEMRREASLTVRVVDVDGAPIEGARVRVEEPFRRSSNWETYATLHTDAAGTATLATAAAGPTRLVVCAPLYDLRVVERDVSPGAQDVRVVLERTGRVVVHVRDADGRPVPASCFEPVWLPELEMSIGGVGFGSFRSRPQWIGPGAYEWTSSTPGSYRVTAHPGGELRFDFDGEFAEVELTLRREPRVSGVVTSADGPVAGAVVRWETPFDRSPMRGAHRALDAPVRTRHTVTDEHGCWSLETTTGEVFLVVTAPAGAKTETSHTFAFDDDVRVDHHLDLAPIRGVVVDEDGRPVANAEVGFDHGLWAFAQLVVGGTIGDGTRVLTGSDGRFAFPTAPGRALTLHVAHDESWCEPIEVGDERGDLRVTMRRGGRLVVDIEDTSGRPFAPGLLMTVRASLENAATGEREQMHGARHAARLTTHAIAPGEYRVAVVRGGGSRRRVLAERTVTLGSGDVEHVTLVVDDR